MTIFIGIAVVIALVIALLLWTSRRTYHPSGPGQDVNAAARRAKTKAQEDVTKGTTGM